MIYHGMIVPYFFLAFTIVPASNVNNGTLSSPTSNSKVPFGPLCP